MEYNDIKICTGKTSKLDKTIYIAVLVVAITTAGLAANDYRLVKKNMDTSAIIENLKRENEALYQKTKEIEKEILIFESKRDKLEEELMRIKPVEIPEGMFD